MERLKTIWKRLQFEAAARDIIDPPQKIINAMEKDGWTFKLHTSAPAGSGYISPVSYAFLIPVTPEGEEVFGYDKENLHKRYQQERRHAAEQAFGMK